MDIADADRPDPRSGRQASQRYADHWARSHVAPPDEVAYRVGYADLLALDSLLTDYRLLDVGCGTGGYLRLAKNAREIVGVDFSETMIAKARELGPANATFACCRYENYTSDRLFDAVRLGGVVGWYAPWPGNADALRRARALLVRDGIVVATYVPPRNLLQWLKSLLFPRRTVVISRRRFLAMARAAGFELLFAVETAHSVQAFLRARPG